MPKRRMTPERRAQIRLWQQASHGGRSRTNPIPAEQIMRGKPWPKAGTRGAFGVTRSHKLGGKGYMIKSGRVQFSAESDAILAGKQGFRDQTKTDLGHPGPAKVPRIKDSWRTPQNRKDAQAAKYARRAAKAAAEAQKIKPSKVHGSGTGKQAWARYK